MDVIMPKMGESINEGTILKWHKKAGDKIKRDEILFEISTDKVDTEVPSPGEGIVSELKYKEGDTVEVGTVVATINESGKAEPSENTKVEEAENLPEIKENNVEEKIEAAGKPEMPVETNQVSEKIPVSNSVDIMMPKMGESVMEGTILKWHKKTGENVKKDEILFEISTDKVDTEVPSPEEGILSEILVKENETVEVGTVVGRLNSSTGSTLQQSEKQVKKDEQDIKTKESAADEMSVTDSMHDNFRTASAEKADRQNRFLSPLVMNIAQKENVSFDELDTIKGTGAGERITKKDILQFIEHRKTYKPEPARKSAPIKTEAVHEQKPVQQVNTGSPRVEKIPMDNIRQKIMQHMVNSRDTSVHVSAMLEVDMTRIHNFIQSNREKYQQNGIKLTYMPFIAQAAVKALKEYPLVNSSIEGNTILKKNYINLGIAVAVEPTGLIVPNIKDADRMNITGLAKAISELAQKARTKKLIPDDITDGTFTITNYGVFGTIFGTPIINQPEVAILGVGAVIKKPVVVQYEETDTIAIKPIMALTISHDHRLIDGMLGGLFLKYLKDILENFDPGLV